MLFSWLPLYVAASGLGAFQMVLAAACVRVTGSHQTEEAAMLSTTRWESVKLPPRSLRGAPDAALQRFMDLCARY